MKKMHIILVGAVMIMASPALADDQPELRYGNDNRPPASSTSSASPQPAINYTDYTVNDDDHGDEKNLPRVSINRPKPDERTNPRR